MQSCARFLAAIVLLAGCAAKTEDPQIQLTDVGFALHLPAPMQAALDSLAPNFRTIRTTSYRSDVSQAAAAGSGGMPALFAVIGDFDGDGTRDAVVEGTTPGDSSLRVITIMNGPTPVAVEVTHIDSYDADAVGVYLSSPTDGRSGAFEIVSYPDSSQLYQYKSGRFTGTSIGN